MEEYPYLENIRDKLIIKEPIDDNKLEIKEPIDDNKLEIIEIIDDDKLEELLSKMDLYRRD